MSYQECWAPGDMAQAQFLIDTAREGEEFWSCGVAEAGRLMDYMADGTETVVDYGCGVGRVIGNLPVDDPVGVDVSEQMLTFARERFPDVRFVLTPDGRSIPLEDSSVDFVYSLLTLQHMDPEDVTEVVRDAGRVLRKGGRALLTFSAFGGNAWAPHLRVPRGPLNWNGQRAGSNSPAHGAVIYTEKVVEMLAVYGGLKIRELWRDDLGQEEVILWAER